MIGPSDRFGPWASGLDAAERKARLRAMRALARVHCGPRAADLVRLLAQAEADPAALDRLAATDRRHVLASYSALSRSAA